MSNADPSDIAYFFVIDGSEGKQYDAFFDVNDFNGFSTGDVRYRPINSEPSAPWVFLSSGGDSEFNESKMLTKEATNDEVDRVFELFTAAIKKVFGSQPSEPESGIARVKWIVKNNMTESNNILTRGD